MLAATRDEASIRKGWRQAHLRCGIHRQRTAELAALGADSMMDSFFMNLTLALRGPGAINEFRRQVEEWLRKNVVIRRQPLPKEAQEWRRLVAEPLRRRVKAGAADKHEAALLHAWDTLFTGDGRNPDSVEHMHGEHCRGNDDGCLGLIATQAMWELLRHIPQPYSRRNWAGHSRAVEQFCMLQAVHQLLSRCFGAVAARAEQRAARGDAGGGETAPSAGARVSCATPARRGMSTCSRKTARTSSPVGGAASRS